MSDSTSRTRLLTTFSSLGGDTGTDPTIQVHYNPTRTAWDDFVSVLNETLNPLDLEIGHMRDEITGKEMLALVCLLIGAL